MILKPREHFQNKDACIVVSHVYKAYGKPRRGGTSTWAVDNVSFALQNAERVALIGPNGAGKSTVLRMLTGILAPSQGEVYVAGFVPWRQMRPLACRIGSVVGNLSSLWADLPVQDSYRLLKCMYGLRDRQSPRKEPYDTPYEKNLIEAFAIGPLLNKKACQLSLGESMRCSLVASLLHRPRILFLDEPTLGLDVVAKATMRDLLAELSRQHGISILMTSHDTADIEKVCERVLILHQGRLLLDAPMRHLRARYIRRKLVTLVTAEPTCTLDLPGISIQSVAPHRTLMTVDTQVVSVEHVLMQVVASLSVHDITVEDPPLEDVLRAMYATSQASCPLRI